MSLTKEQAEGVGSIPSGLFIVCAKNESKVDGYLASFVQQISFSPLLLTMAIKPGRPAYDLIKEGTVFSINVVGDHDKTYLKHFWSGYDPDNNPFEQIPHTISEHGTIVFDGARSVIHAKIVSSSTPGDHELLIAEVLDSKVLNAEAKPMVHVRKNGLDY